MKKQKIRKTDIKENRKPFPSKSEIVTVQFSFREQSFYIESLRNYCERGMFDSNPSYNIIGFFDSYDCAFAYADAIRVKYGWELENQ